MPSTDQRLACAGVREVSIRVTEQELNELLSYIQNDACWSQSEENPLLWMYSPWTREAQEDQFAIMLVLEAQDGLFPISVMPLAAGEGAEGQFESLLTHRTAYGQRLRVAQFLQECGHDSIHAGLLAIGLQQLEVGHEHDPAKPVPGCLQQEVILPEAAEGGRIPVKTFFLREGGYVQLDLIGDRLRLDFSAPSDPHEQGYPCLLRGFVHPLHSGCVFGHAAGYGQWSWKKTEGVGQLAKRIDE